MPTLQKYVFLEPGDVTQKGDEFHAFNGWAEVTEIGRILSESDAGPHRFRRAVSSPYEYVLLGPYDVILSSDEAYLRHLGGWTAPNGMVGYPLCSENDPYMAVYRRRNPDFVPPVVDPVEETEYRLLKKGEVIETGDEYWRGGAFGWSLALDIGVKYHSDIPYRRVNIGNKVLPDLPSGYRLLSPEDIVEEGDEYWSWLKSCWEPTEFPGDNPTLLYRRRIKQKYQMLQPGEPFLPGDELSDDGVDWDKWNPIVHVNRLPYPVKGRRPVK